MSWQSVLGWVSGLTCAAVLGASAAQRAHADEPGAGNRKGKEKEIEEVVVTSSPLGKSAEDLAVPVEVLDRDSVLDEGGGTLADTLRSQVGVTTTSFAAGASRPVIRGQDQLRVRVLENGIGTGDVSAISADHGVTINPLVTERLEIVRGPATLRYGGGAIGGVVNAITNRIPQDRIQRPLAAELFTGYGTGARERNLAGLLQGDAGPLTWHLDALSVDSRDYDVPGHPDTQLNTGTDSTSFSGGGAYIGEKLRAGLSATRYRSEYGIPAPEDPAAPSSIDLEQDHYAFELDAAPGGEWIDQIRVRGARTQYDHDEVVRGEGVTSSFANEDFEVRTELVHRTLLGFDGALGLQLQDVDFSAGGEGGELLPPSDTNLYGIYLFESKALSDRLNLELGGRVERVVVDGTTPAGRAQRFSFNPLSASAGLLYDIDDVWSVGLTLTAAQRAPDALELFSQGPHDATETFELGDPRNEEERSTTADFLVRGAMGPVSGQVSLFYTDYANFTFGRLTGTSRDEDGTQFADPDSGELRDLVYTQDDATFTGAEVALRWEIGALGDGLIALEMQGDFVRARLSSGNVPRIPPRRFGAGLAYDSQRLSGQLGFQHVAAQDELADFEERTPGYTTLDGSLRLQIAGSDERPVDLTISARNLLDERARNHVSFKKEDVLLPGRDVRVGLHMRF